MQDKTLLFLRKPSKQQVLLAMKKRDFGKGKWNGVGGKLAQGESIEDAVIRETFEEIGVIVQPTALKKHAELTFLYAAKPEWDCVTHTYVVTDWEGVPTESEEMRPQWFNEVALPYNNMWEDDQYWLPTVLAGGFVRTTFTFNTEGKLEQPGELE